MPSDVSIVGDRLLWEVCTAGRRQKSLPSHMRLCFVSLFLAWQAAAIVSARCLLSFLCLLQRSSRVINPASCFRPGGSSDIRSVHPMAIVRAGTTRARETRQMGPPVSPTRACAAWFVRQEGDQTKREVVRRAADPCSAPWRWTAIWRRAIIWSRSRSWSSQ